MRISLAFALLLFSDGAAHAQGAHPILWKGLQAGDTPEQVVAKLAADSAIKSAKVKRGRDPSKEPSVAIRYAGDGISIFGLSFKILPAFTHGVLTRVALSTEPMCTNDAIEQFRSMALALHDKYPTSPVGLDQGDEASVRTARANGTDERPATASRLFSGGGVTVYYQQQFTAEPSPMAGYVDNPRVAMLMRLLINQYESRVRECDGTGDHRMTHRLIYMTDADFKAVDQDIRAGHGAELEAAKSNL